MSQVRPLDETNDLKNVGSRACLGAKALKRLHTINILVLKDHYAVGGIFENFKM